MARPLRIQFKDAHYHVIARGDELKPLFVDQRDFRKYIRLLHRYKGEFSVNIFAYCLMNTHIHMGIKTPLANLSQFMHALLTAYTVYYNWRHKRRGHLFQGRFKSPLVDKDSYLLELSRYIHNQAVRAGICSTSGEYQWSSYRFYITSRISQVVSPEIVLNIMDENILVARKKYAKFVEAELGCEVQEEVKKKGIYGSDEFQQKIRKMMKGKSDKDLPEVRILRRGVEIGTIKKAIARKLGFRVEFLEVKRRKDFLEARDLGLYLSRIITGKTFFEIGREFGNLHETVVSRRVKAVYELLQKNKKLRSLLDEIAEEI